MNDFVFVLQKAPYRKLQEKKNTIAKERVIIS